MNESTYQALMLAFNLFIFVVALSAGMMLISNINQMVELTKTSIEYEVGGNLIKEYGDEAERTFTGAEVFAFYGQKVQGKLNDVTIKVKAGGSETDIETYGKNTGMGYLRDTFVLECRGEKNYLFRKVD